MKGVIDAASDLISQECEGQQKVAVLYAMPCGCVTASVHPAPPDLLDGCVTGAEYYAVVSILMGVGHTREEIALVSKAMAKALESKLMREEA